MVHDSAVRDDPAVRSPDIGAITLAMQQAIDAMVYACEKRGLRATSMDMRDALAAAMPFLCVNTTREQVIDFLRSQYPSSYPREYLENQFDIITSAVENA